MSAEWFGENMVTKVGMLISSKAAEVPSEKDLRSEIREFSHLRRPSSGQ